jgi:tRNA threonylcarbamoyladenosine biosynthesis protein TsaE
MPTFISRSADQTVALGQRWGQEAARGWIIGLQGELGAGKTQLVKGLALGLGIRARVHSPTFALLHEYHGGRLVLVHLDLYRLETRKEILAAGLTEYFDHPSGLTVVEWAERWFGTEKHGPGCDRTAAAFYRSVRITSLDEDTRRIVYEDSGG